MKYWPLWLFLFALALRLLVIGVFGLDGLYGQDAFAYFDCARQLLQLHSGQSPCHDFYWPLGYPALAALFMLATRGALLGAQLSSVVTGSAIAPLTYWLVMEGGLTGIAGLRQREIARAAGLIVALCGTLMISSTVVMSDAAGLFWATLAACLVLRWERSAVNRSTGWPWLVLASTALAIAIVTRWIFAPLLLPFSAFISVALHRGGGRAAVPGREPADSRRLPRLAASILAASVLLLIVLPQIYVTQHSGAPLTDHGWLADWNLRNALRTSFDNPEGHFAFRLPPIIFYAEPLFHPLYLFPLLTAGVFYGAWQLRRSPALILIGGWIITLGVYFIGIPQENLRFGLAMFTPVAVLAGVGVFCFPIRLSRPTIASGANRSDAGVWAWSEIRLRWLLLALSLALAVPFTYRAFSRFQSASASQRTAIRYLQSQLPADATVFTFELSVALEYYTHMHVVDLSARSADDLRLKACGRAAVYLYADTAKLESQWSKKAPGQNFRRLRDQIGLQLIGVQGNWSLYRVQRCDP